MPVVGRGRWRALGRRSRHGHMGAATDALCCGKTPVGDPQSCLCCFQEPVSPGGSERGLAQRSIPWVRKDARRWARGAALIAPRRRGSLLLQLICNGQLPNAIAAATLEPQRGSGGFPPCFTEWCGVVMPTHRSCPVCRAGLAPARWTTCTNAENKENPRLGFLQVLKQAGGGALVAHPQKGTLHPMAGEAERRQRALAEALW